MKIANTKPADKPPDQKADDARHAEYQSGNDGSHDGQQRREDHFSLCAFGGNLHAAGIIRFGFSAQDALDFTELPPHFLYHVGCCTPYGVHGQPAEKESHHAADEHAREDFRVHQRHVIVGHEVGERSIMYGQRVAVRQGQYSFAQARQTDADFFDIGC